MSSAVRLNEPALAERICVALQELGGIYSAFARFLGWRFDLLSADSVGAFRRVRNAAQAVPVAHFAEQLRTSLGAQGEPLAAGLEPQALWSTLFRCAYRSTHRGSKVVVQLARDPFPSTAIRQFKQGLRGIPGISGLLLSSEEVLDQFEQWLQLSQDPGRERSYLEAVREINADTSFCYPQLIPEISAGRILCWRWIEGEPVSDRLKAGDTRAATDLAELVLGETIMLGMVDGDLDLESIIRISDGRLAVRRWNQMIALPPAMLSPALKYLSGVMSRNYPLAVRMLLRLALGRYSGDLEPAMLKQLSNSQPELKGRLLFPASATVFESNWLALANLLKQRPLYLDCLHRNLSAVAYWAAESVKGEQPQDCLAEAQFAVLGSLLRRRAGDLFKRDISSEWMLGSGMLFVEGIRQVSRMADDLRDEDVSIGVDLTRMPAELQDKERNTRQVMALGILLLLFLFCLHFGPRVAAPWSLLLGLLATVASGTLFWVVVRIG